MPLILIKGTFHVVGYSPDGDSIRFKAKNAENWNKLEGIKSRLNEFNHLRVRIQGIDTLETHFYHYCQPSKFADYATKFMLNAIGIDAIIWDSMGKIKEANDGREGFILTNKTDKHGRPISFVFAGEIDAEDGDEFFLNKELLRASINYKLLEAGLAYPTFFRDIFPSIRHQLSYAVQSARIKAVGLWNEDRTNTGFLVEELSKVVIMPKLFRRLVSYIENNQGIMTGFKDSLCENSEPILIFPGKKLVHLYDIITEEEDKIKLTEFPENLVFL